MRYFTTTLACLTLVFLFASPVAATSGPGDGDPLDSLGSGTTKKGFKTSASVTVGDRAKKGQDLKTAKPDEPAFEFRSVLVCHERFSSTAIAACEAQNDDCTGNTPEQGQGPLGAIYRREVAAKFKAPNEWKMIGLTCFPDRSGKSEPGAGQVLAAFHETVLAKPVVHIQPEGNLTLVTLPTFFEVTWPKAGFQPGEIETKDDLLGHKVEIRPNAQDYTYFFGDETHFGPTRSPGGIYPDGDIVHEYDKGGVYPTHIEVNYGGEYRVDGGAWKTIPGTVTISGPIQQLAVKTSHARLVAPPDGRP